MKRNFKKIVSLSLCTAMAFGTLAGCSSKSADETTAATTAAATTAEAAKDGETAAAGETSDKPFEGVTLKYATTQTCKYRRRKFKAD